MRLQLRDRAIYIIERLMLRGAQWRLVVIAFAVALIALVGGLLVLAGGEHFDSPGAAVWWAFLRLTDPGYLGDDVGTWRRVVSTALTIAGYVIFLGALIAVMTQWLNAFMRSLEQGLTPIVKQGHILILGWTDRTPTIVRELILSEARVRRFLARHDTRRLDIVILAEEAGQPLVQELRDQLGRRYDARRIVLRTGTPLRLAHLQRVDYLRASVIVLPGSDFSGGAVDREAAEMGLTISDTMAIKILLSIANHAADGDVRHLPPVVAEVLDARKVPVAENAYSGAVEVVASDLIISRLIAQNVRNSGLSHVATELLTHSRGNELFIRELPDAAGQTLGELARCFPAAIVVGLVRPEGRRFRPLLCAGGEVEFLAGDRLVLIARTYDDTEPRKPGDVAVLPDGNGARALEKVRDTPGSDERRVLILGWSHRVPALLSEFAAYERERFAIDVFSAIPAAERTRQLARYGPVADTIALTHIEGDFTVPAELTAAAPSTYDNVVLIGSSWLESREASDARTILGYLLLRDELAKAGKPDILIELMDSGNLSLFREQPGEVLISPEIVSHILAQVALRPELGAVFDELFGPDGAEIRFESAADLGLTAGPVTFVDAMAAASRQGGVAIGLRRGADRGDEHGGIRLNPSRRDRHELGKDDDVIVLVAE